MRRESVEASALTWEKSLTWDAKSGRCHYKKRKHFEALEKYEEFRIE